MNLAMAPHSLLILCTISLCFHGLLAMDYQVTNLAPDLSGAKRLMEFVGIQGAKEIMGQANEYVWSTIFQQNSPETRKPIDSPVQLFFVNNDTYKSISENNVINISANYIPDTKEGVKEDFARSVYFQMTYVFQWNGDDKCTPVQEGIGYYTVVKIKLIPDSFPEPGDGDTWDQEPEVTGRFLEYCDEVTPGFVAKINEKMKTTCDLSYFKEITGKSVEELWKAYKSKHGSN